MPLASAFRAAPRAISMLYAALMLKGFCLSISRNEHCAPLHSPIWAEIHSR